MFDYAIKRHLVRFNPAAAFDLADAGGKELARERALSRDERVTLFEAMRQAKGFGVQNELTVMLLLLLLLLAVRKRELVAARVRVDPGRGDGQGEARPAPLHRARLPPHRPHPPGRPGRGAARGRALPEPQAASPRAVAGRRLWLASAWARYTRPGKGVEGVCNQHDHFERRRRALEA